MKQKGEIFVHVFFVDVVSLSNRDFGSTETQNNKLQVLFKLITNNKNLKNQMDSVIMNHFGDGVAICFRDSPRSPFELSIDLNKKLKSHNKNKKTKEKIHVRIGISSGLISEMNGVGNRGNYWGRGLIQAQRIMNAGDANHILIGAATAKELIEVSEKYGRQIHYVGDVKIKHGEIIPIYSAYDNGFGNKEKPNSIKQQTIQDTEKSGRLILEGLKRSEMTSKTLWDSFKQKNKSKLSSQSQKKKEGNKK